MAWQGLGVAPLPAGRRELVRRVLMAVAVICVLPVLCALLLLPFFYYTSDETAPPAMELKDSQLFSLPEYEMVDGKGLDSTVYDWLRLDDPRQWLLPDTRAGFSKFLQFQPRYAAAAFPIYQSSKPPAQPQYDELFSRIAPHFPRAIVNEQIHELWQREPARGYAPPALELRPGAQRPVWRLADGTPVPSAEEPVLTDDALEYWRSPETRERLAKRLRLDTARTILEIQILPTAAIPQLDAYSRTLSAQDDPRISATRVVLRKSCGEPRLDQAAATALRQLLGKQSVTMSAPPGRFLVQVDWGCW